MILFSGLLLAHLLYDFHWQGPFIADMKSGSWFLLGVHALTWALLLAAVVWALGNVAWWTVPFLFVTHFGIDAWKARYGQKPLTVDPLGAALWIDQGLHLMTIVVVVLW